MRQPFLIGKQVYVRGVECADLPAMIEWVNDHDATKYMFTGDRPALLERLQERWEAERESHNTIPFAVCTKNDDTFVGTTGLYEIQWIMRTAEFRIFLGAKNHWNRGIGTECARLMLVYAFDKLNLNRVQLGVNAANEGAVRSYEKSGFLREGVLREEQYRNFRYYDVIRMAMLRREYETLRDQILEAIQP